MRLELDQRELGTVLAALRHYQNEGDLDKELHAEAAGWDIASDAGRLEPLGIEEIDKLCERINIGETASPPRVVVAVRGGLADLVAKPRGVAVSLYDYDTEGEACRVIEWNEAEEVTNEEDV